MRLIIDSNYVCCALKFSLSEGLVYRGSRTEIIYGFLKVVFSLSRRFKTNDFIFCWDSVKSLRKEIYPDYKKSRRAEKSEEEKEKDIIAFSQFNILRDKVLFDLGFSNVFWQEGYEADDIIASLVIGNKGREKSIVVSTDKDLYQLLNWCSLCSIRGDLYVREMFVREYGINPLAWRKVRRIAGCGSDGVEGVRGVGEKTAIKFIKGELSKGQTLDRILAFDYSLTEKITSLPLEGCNDFTFHLKNNKFSREKFERVFREYGFNSFFDRIEKNIYYFL